MKKKKFDGPVGPPAINQAEYSYLRSIVCTCYISMAFCDLAIKVIDFVNRVNYFAALPNSHTG